MSPIVILAGRHKRALQAVVAGLAVLLCGCTGVGNQLPTNMGGLPGNAPQRAAEQPTYPAVFDAPPPRPDPAISTDQQLKLEKDLAAARARQEKLQDPNAKQRADEANARNKAAMERARAAGKIKPDKSDD